MKIRGINILGRTVGVLLALVCFAGMLPRCANPASPQGGPRDSLPPLVVRMNPQYMTTDFKGRRIFIEFDEYVQLKDLMQEFYVSPALKRMPTVTVRGRGVQIDIHQNDTLKENTTYAFNLGNSVRDNNENNTLYGLRYVMSTGPEIDSLVMSGYTVDAFKKDSFPKTLLFFYDAARDTIPEYDSLIFKGQPDVIGRAQTNGIFLAENLKPIPYKVYAVGDKNNNKTYDPGVDFVGFLDSLVNPAEMPGFSVCYDTIRKYLVAEPQTYFRLFQDKAFRRHSLSRVSRPVQHQMVLVFSAPYPEIESIRFDGIDSARVIREYLRPTRDSLALWFDVPSEQLPDTIKGEITLMRHDSVNRWERATLPLKGAWRFIESNDARRARERQEKEIKKLIEDGKEVPEEPNTFKYDVDAANPLNPEKNITLMFGYPLAEMDSARISLIRMGDNDAKYRVPFTIEQDTMNIRSWTIKAPWMSANEYQLEIPDGVFTNIIGERNDTLKAKFTVMDPEKYASVTVNVQGKTDTSKYVLQLIDLGGKVLREVQDATTGTYHFLYVSPGRVQLRVVEDLNGNGEWDAGDLVQRMQPERVEVYVDEKGVSEITTRTNWENELDVDMAEMFAPITIQSVMDELDRQEAERLNKYLERQEARKKQQQQKNRQGPTGGTTFNPAGLF